MKTIDHSGVVREDGRMEPYAVFINNGDNVGVCVEGDPPDPGTILRVTPNTLSFGSVEVEVVGPVETPQHAINRGMTYLQVVWKDSE